MMMRKQNYDKKIMELKNYRRAASPDHQMDIDFIIFGMQWAIGETKDEDLHNERMELLFSDIESDRRKGEAYRKGMDIVLYSVRGKKREKGTVVIPPIRVPVDIKRGLGNIKDFLNLKTDAAVRKAALRWYIEMMNEKHGRDFFK